MKKQILFLSVVVLLQTANCVLPAISYGQKIASSDFHALAICIDSTVMGWGDNYYGELGNGTNNNSNIPVQVNSLTDIIAVTAGNYTSFALKMDGTVYGWGDGIFELLGFGGSSNLPVLQSLPSGIAAISTGGGHVLALQNDSTILSWGSNVYGQIGNGFFGYVTYPPEQVTSLTGAIAISCAREHSMALKADGTVWTWGHNNYGQLGDGTYNSSDVPIQVTSLSGIIAISGGTFHSLALRSDGTVWAWGLNDVGELGDGTNNDSNVPVQVNSLSNVTAISAKGYHSLALKMNGEIWAWGRNANGELGNGNNTDSNIPIQTNFTDGRAVAAGYWHSIALRNDSSLWAWGYNGEGELGNGNNSGSNSPVQTISLCLVPSSCHAAFTLVADTSLLHHYWALNQVIGDPISYLWSWGDSTYDTIAYPSHTYASAGFYNICLSIRDQLGCFDSLCSSYDVQKLSEAAAENTIVTVDVVDTIPSIPTTIENNNVLQSWSVFPNPAAANSFINYTLSTAATVSIALYDVLGNKLQQVVNGNQQQGEHNATLDAHKLSNGVYLLQIRAGEQVAEEKVVLLR